MNRNRTLPDVVLLPGIWDGTSRLRRLGDYLQKHGARIHYHAYDTSGSQPLEHLGAQLAERIKTFSTAPCIVAFSMGGLVTRAALGLHRARATAAVFLNSPHHGSMLAWCLPFLPSVWQMRPGSPLLAQLRGTHIDCPSLAVWCPGDLMVIPGSSALLPGAARTVRCAVPQHTWPLHCPRFHRIIHRFIRRCCVLASGACITTN
jgi:pimeloyl-ACP methyl ester carboxylesterase